jgi:hypothetical protein
LPLITAGDATLMNKKFPGVIEKLLPAGGRQCGLKVLEK